MKLEDYLSSRSVPYETILHRTAYTATELAESVHITGHEVAKTVLLRTRDGYLIAIVPATRLVDLAAIENLLGERPVTLATEDEAAVLFPEVERGVVPPFGGEYGIRTIVDIHLAGKRSIVFEGCSHHEAVRLRYSDFEMLEMPIVGLISTEMALRPKRRIAEEQPELTESRP